MNKVCLAMGILCNVLVFSFVVELIYYQKYETLIAFTKMFGSILCVFYLIHLMAGINKKG